MQVPPGRPQPGWRARQGAPTGRTGPVFTPAPRPGGPRNRVPPIVKKRGDGLERRPPAGIARERETSADGTAPCQCERLTPSQHRMPRSLTAPPTRGRAFFMPSRVCGPTRSWGFLPAGLGTSPPEAVERRSAAVQVVQTRPRITARIRKAQGGAIRTPDKAPFATLSGRAVPTGGRRSKPSPRFLFFGDGSFAACGRGADRRSAFQAVPALLLRWRCAVPV